MSDSRSQSSVRPEVTFRVEKHLPGITNRLRSGLVDFVISAFIQDGLDLVNVKVPIHRSEPKYALGLPSKALKYITNKLEDLSKEYSSNPGLIPKCVTIAHLFDDEQPYFVVPFKASSMGVASIFFPSHLKNIRDEERVVKSFTPDEDAKIASDYEYNWYFTDTTGVVLFSNNNEEEHVAQLEKLRSQESERARKWFAGRKTRSFHLAPRVVYPNSVYSLFFDEHLGFPLAQVSTGHFPPYKWIDYFDDEAQAANESIHSVIIHSTPPAKSPSPKPVESPASSSVHSVEVRSQKSQKSEKEEEVEIIEDDPISTAAVPNWGSPNDGWGTDPYVPYTKCMCICHTNGTESTCTHCVCLPKHHEVVVFKAEEPAVSTVYSGHPLERNPKSMSSQLGRKQHSNRTRNPRGRGRGRRTQSRRSSSRDRSRRNNYSR
jgi:hypothetical protein